MNRTLIAIALAASFCGSQAVKAEGRWTVHTASVHFGIDDDVEINNINPGIGYDVVPGRYRIGGLYNSFKLPSFYAARLFPVGNRVRFGLGAITGYTWDSDHNTIVGKANGIVPLISVEADITKHISVVYFGQAINLEIKF